VIYTGQGTLRVMGIPTGGSFVNVIEFDPLDGRTIATRSTIFVRVDNGLKRFLARVVFAVSDLEETIKEKLFELDGTVVKVLKQLLDDPALPALLAAPVTPEERAAYESLTGPRDRNPAAQPEAGERRRGRRGRRAEAKEIEEQIPELEEPLRLTTLEMAAYLRRHLQGDELAELVSILARWYAGPEPVREARLP